jgi:tetratricopeptide (TPR) repeat protein
MLAEALWYEGRREEFRAALGQAQELVQGHELSVSVARVRAQTARYAMLDDENDEAIRIGREALDMAERLGLDELRASVLSTIGTAMSNSEPGSGDELLREAVAIGTALNSLEAPRALNNLAVSAFFQGSLRGEHELLLESRAAAERLGSDNFVRFAEGNLCWTAYAIGEWDESLSRCDAFIAECEAGSAHASEGIVQDARAEIFLGRDDLDRALRAWSRAAELSPGVETGRGAVRAQLLAARMLLEIGRIDEARAALLTALDKSVDRMYTPQAVSFVLLADALGLSDRIEEFLGRVGSGPWREMAGLVAVGELAEAARRIDDAGYRSLGAQVRLRSQEDGELAKAIDFFDSVGATRYLMRAEAQLAALA